MDGDDEYSCPAPAHHTLPSHDMNSITVNHHPTSTSREFDITNFNYGGAVDSQDQSTRDSLRSNQKAARTATHSQSRLRSLDGKEQTPGETQFSCGTQSSQAGTYESHPPGSTGRADPDITALTTGTAVAASLAPRADLPIINVSTLSLIHELSHLAKTNNPPNVSILAVVFDIGELKEIPRRRNERGVLGGQQRSIKLCAIKVCQPGPGNRMAIIDVTMWGDMADRVRRGEYCLVKGDIVWLSSTVPILPESKAR